MPKSFLASSVAFSLVLLSSVCFGQKANVQPSCDANPAATSPGVRQSLPSCGGTGGGGTGGGGSTPSPTLNWSTSSQDSQTVVGGASGRNAVGAAVFQNSMYVAYTSTKTTDSSGNAPVYVGRNVAGGPNFQNAGVPLVTTAASNPALANIEGTQLWMAVGSGTGGVYTYYSVDGSHWTSGPSCGTNFQGSPTIAEFTHNGLHYIYVALQNNYNFNPRNAAQALALCVIPYSASQSYSITPTVTYFNTAVGFVPGMVQYTPPNGVPTLYIAYPTQANSHNLYYYTTTDGVSFTYSSAAAGDQSSTTPSLAVHNGYLYMAFRTNDGDHKFIWKYSTDGSTWSQSYTNGSAMAGAPALVSTGASSSSTQTFGSISNLNQSLQNGDLFNFLCC